MLKYEGKINILEGIEILLRDSPGIDALREKKKQLIVELIKHFKGLDV